MSRIFLSHSSKDNASAVALRDWLAAHGWDDVFLDLDARRGITAGDRWERALNQAALRCEAVLFLVSRGWLGSDWCMKEFNLAHRLNKRLFGLLIEDIPVSDLPATLTDTWQLVQLASGRDHTMLRALLPGSQNEVHLTFSQDGLTRLRVGLERAGLDARFFAWPPDNDPGRPPYRGLLPLEGGDAGIFFGREAPTVEALDRIRGINDGAAPRLLVLLGASGAGKSSFLRAGLLPRLTRDDRNYITLPIIRPERAALSGEAGLLRSLETAFAANGIVMPRADIRTAINGGAETLRPLLRKLVARVRASLVAEDESIKAPTLVLAVDQGEELFLADGAAESAALLGLLKDLLLDDDPALFVIVTIRSDSYEQFQTAKPLEGVNQQTLSLVPMPRGAYQAVIEGPAHRLKETDRALVVEPTLTQALLSDIEDGGGRDALPLLAFTLERLYLEYGGSGRLALKDYDALGRIKGSIEAAVERAFSAANSDSRIPRDRDARLALVRRGLIPWLAGIDPDTGSPRRQKARLSEIPEETLPLINLLVEQRLLSTDIAEDTKERTIEPAHEALLRQWGSLQGWLHEDFAALTTLETVKRAARDWAANAKSDDWLAHRAGRLEDAELLLGRPDLTSNFSSADRDYLAACSAKEAAERKAKAEALELKLKMQRRFSIAAVVAAVIMAGVGGVAYHLKTKADAATILATSEAAQAEASEKLAKEQRDQALLSESRFLSEAAQQVLSRDGDPGTALALALEALPDQKSNVELTRTRTYWAPAEASVGSALRALREQVVLAGHTEELAVAVSRDGNRIVTGSYDRTARVWDAKTGAELLKVEAPAVTSVAMTPDGTRFVTGSTDGVARVWDTTSGLPLLQLKGHTNQVTSVAVTADGTRIVTGSYDGSARIWDAQTGVELLQLKGHTEGVRAVAVFPDGKRIVTASDDQTARVWDATTGAELLQLKGHKSNVSSVAVSSDGTRILTGSQDQTARLWDAESGAELLQLRGHTSGISAVAMTPDGRFLVTSAGALLVGATDAALRIWDAKTGAELSRLNGHTRRVNSLAVTADGSHIVSGSKDGTARVWTLRPGTNTVELPGHERPANILAVTSDSKRVVTVSGTTARVWDIDSGAEIATLKGHTGKIDRLAATPDGKKIVSASLDATARVWDATTGAELVVFKGHTAALADLAITPDGMRVVTVSADGTARIWNIATGAEIVQFKGHAGPVSHVAVMPDGRRVITSSSDNTTRVWDANTGAQLFELEDAGRVQSLTVTADGSRIITGSDRTRIWDAKTGTKLAALRDDDRTLGMRDLAVTADGKLIVTVLGTTEANQSKIRIWDATTGAEIARIDDHPGWISGVTVTPDGKRIITSASSIFNGDDAIRIWDLSSGALLDTLRGHTGLISALVVTPDGKHLVSGANDPSVRIWDIFPTGQALVDEAQRLAPRCLSAEQRRRFHLAVSPPAWCDELGKWPNAEDAYAAQGNLSVALQSYQLRLKAAERLAKAEPGNATSQRQLASAYQHVGDAQVLQHDLNAALNSYQAGSAIIERIAQAQPGNITMQRELSVWDSRIAGVQRDRSNPAPALSLYQASLAILQRIAKLDPSNSVWQDNFASAYYDLGQMQNAQGNTAAGLESFRSGAAVAEIVARSDPKNDQRQMSLASWHDAIGFAEWRLGDYPASIQSYQRSAAIMQQVISVGGGLPDQRRQLSGTLAALSFVDIVSRKFDDAMDVTKQSLALTPGWVWLSLNRAHALMFHGETDQARALYLKYRGEKDVEDGKPWETVALDDFGEFRKAGLTSPLMDEIEKLFKPASR